MAVMQAMSLKLSLAEKEQFTKKFFVEFYGQFYNDEYLELTAKSLRASVDGRLENKVRKVERFLKPLMDLPWADQLADELGMERVICHGDLWSANLLWRENGADDVHLAAIVDFQVDNKLIL
ncbi:hypothetical protein OESDEN_12075 [Oesophagostomum dentatum]|uniref:CHK kinase-like domain-containing protein n=1 Tax=Oesophagostomum dentatum TaxID=61180 RepID=A0A0B1SYC0_OESDE|nr:hypothetical protein OESDEN_12075 [Oesophagostomum dentatum]